MILKNEIATVNVFIKDRRASALKIDKSFYKDVLNYGDYASPDDSSLLFVIDVHLRDREYKIASFADINSWDEKCALLEGQILTWLQGFSDIFQLNVATGEIIGKHEIDSYGPLFGLYRLKDGYVLHGELDIIGLDKDFHQQWLFSGYDIFATRDGKTPFEIKSDRICLYDFLDNYYEIDFEGKTITRDIKCRY